MTIDPVTLARPTLDASMLNPPILDPLVMLPGMMCDDRLFAPQVEAFSSDRQVIIPALSGAETITDLARLLLTQLPGRFALAGLSMGGIVAMEMMRQAPSRISRLALLDTNPFAEDKDRQAIRDQQMAKVQNGALQAVMRDDMKPHYLAASQNRQQVVDLCMEMALDLGAAVFIDQSKALASRPDQAAHLPKITVPCLVLYGAEDRLCPADRHDAMHDLIPTSKLVKIEGAGHLPCLEQPEQTTAALQRWLEEQ